MFTGLPSTATTTVWKTWSSTSPVCWPPSLWEDWLRSCVRTAAGPHSATPSPCRATTRRPCGPPYSSPVSASQPWRPSSHSCGDASFTQQLSQHSTVEKSCCIRTKRPCLKLNVKGLLKCRPFHFSQGSHCQPSFFGQSFYWASEFKTKKNNSYSTKSSKKL